MARTNMKQVSHFGGDKAKMVSDQIGIVQPSARGVAPPTRKPRVIQQVPTLLNDGIRLGDTDRKVRMVQLER